MKMLKFYFLGSIVWTCLLRFLIAGAIIGFTMLYKGEFEQDTNIKIEKNKEDPDFIKKFERHITFIEPTGVAIPCGLHYWVSRNYYNTQLPGKLSATFSVKLRFV